jgi:predicted O-methyltransferase YrrM
MDDTARDFHALGREHLEQPPDFDRRTFDQLLAERPHLHGRGSVHDWGLSQRTLSYLFKVVRPGWKTLEVGAGLSTIVFALKGADHIAISPVPEEHARIEQWCRSHGLSCDRLSFVLGPSEQALPALETELLDLVLIDGRHAFPSPFINWYFSASLLSVGGILILDDSQLRTYRILSDFLRAEKGRWKVEAELTNLLGASDAIAFRKLSPAVHLHFSQQPWMAHSVGRRKAWSVAARSWRRTLRRLRSLIRRQTRSAV